MTSLTMWSDKDRPAVVSIVFQFATALHFYWYETFTWISAEKNYTVCRNLAENHKPQQNTANPNISSIFHPAGFIFKKIG